MKVVPMGLGKIMLVIFHIVGILMPYCLYLQLLSTVLINSIPEKSSLNLNSKAKVNDTVRILRFKQFINWFFINLLFERETRFLLSVYCTFSFGHFVVSAALLRWNFIRVAKFEGGKIISPHM